MTGETIDSYFGYAVSGAGDVNGDGYSDVIVGSFYYGASHDGKAYIYYGGINMNNIPDVILNGFYQSKFGISVSNAGDVNGDSFSDVIVGANIYNYPNGGAFIYYGGTSMNNQYDVLLNGCCGLTLFGEYVSTAGDINGDGFSDVIVGSEGYNSSTGRVLFYYGGSPMNNLVDTILYGEAIQNSFGVSATSAGDVNGDSIPDVIVGAYGYNSNRGKAYIYINLRPKPELINPSNYSINNPTTIIFKWKKLTTTIYYVLYISTDSSFNNIVVNDTIFVDTSKTVSGFQKDTKYYWRVSAKDTSGVTNNSSIWNYRTIPPLKISLKVLMEGMYYPLFNQLSRKDTVTIYLRNVTSPYALRDSSINTIDSLSFSGLFTFMNVSSGTYHIVVKHFNCIETWSKVGGEIIIDNGSIYNYDFTISNSQAYGNNLKLKGTKWTIFSGDINQDGTIDAGDLSLVDNAVYNSITGRVSEDVTGDNFVDGADLSIVDNNVFNSVIKITP